MPPAPKSPLVPLRKKQIHRTEEDGRESPLEPSLPRAERELRRGGQRPPGPPTQLQRPRVIRMVLAPAREERARGGISQQSSLQRDDTGRTNPRRSRDTLPLDFCHRTNFSPCHRPPRLPPLQKRRHPKRRLHRQQGS